MIIHDYRCTECGMVEERYVKAEEIQVTCNKCSGISDRVILRAAQPHWASLAQGKNASPEAIARFDRVHRQQKDKEAKSMREHGDYGTAPGGDGGRDYSAT